MAARSWSTEQELGALVASAADDPYALIIRLLPAWAMSASAVEEACRVLRSAALTVRRRRGTVRTFLVTLNTIASTVSLRPDVLRTFPRPAAPTTALRPRDWIASRVCLPDVARQYTRLRKTGSHLVGHCPLHHDTRPSFTIYPNGTFFCFGCGAWGDAIDLLIRVEGISAKAAIRVLLRQHPMTSHRDRSSSVHRSGLRPGARSQP